MAILGDLLGGFGVSRRRSHGLWNRGHGRGRTYFGRGYGRSPGFWSGSMGRLAMGGLAAWLARSYFTRRSMHH